MEKKDEISILYVEDQDDVRLFLSKILSRHYTNVFLAENGKEGLEFYIDNKPDIIISDIKMPVMDGLSMSARIKEIDPAAKIILTTAHSDMEYFLHSIDIGINQYILKPIDRDKLFTAIDTCAKQVMMEKEVEQKRQELIRTNEKLVKQERELRENLQKTIALKEIISRNEENFRQLAENIEDAFWLCENRKVLYVNKSFEQIFGISLSDFYEDSDNIFKVIHPDDKDDFKNILNRHEDSGQGSIEKELRVLLPENKIKYIWYRDTFFSHAKNQKYRRAATASDISRKKDFERLQKELFITEQSTQLKRNLLNNVSHEMRTPLNGILAVGELMRQASADEKQLEFANIIRQSGHSLMEMINDLLDVNDLESAQVAVTPETITTRDFADKIRKHFEGAASQKKLDLKIIIQENVPQEIVSDAKKLFQISRNLISNALKFTTKGGISFEMNCLDSKEDQAIMQIKVTDTGIGIKPEAQERIFQLFSQADSSLSRNYEGLGLGLTISARLVSTLKGELKVESMEGSGSTFTVVFPATLPEKGVDSSQTEATAIPHLDAKILYAEDKAVNQRVISIMLENAGCSVDCVSNGLEALNTFTQNPAYDIILMDIQMPVMDGITATQKLKARFPGLPPVIAISANALEEDAGFYIQQGLDDYIPKPVDSHILYRKIQFWLDKNGPGKLKVSEIENNPKNTQEELIDNDRYTDLDLNVIEELKRQSRNNPDLVADLYKTFLMEADNLMQTIRQATKDQNNELLKEATHALKGLSSTVGAVKLFRHTHYMDSMHKKGDFLHSRILSDALEEDYKTLKKIIMDHFGL